MKIGLRPTFLFSITFPRCFPEETYGKLRVPSGVCIYIPGYVYIPFPEIGYVKGMYLIEKVCKTAFTAMFPG